MARFSGQCSSTCDRRIKVQFGIRMFVEIESCNVVLLIFYNIEAGASGAREWRQIPH
jgi:hypothetical protein